MRGFHVAFSAVALVTAGCSLAFDPGTFTVNECPQPLPVLGEVCTDAEFACVAACETGDEACQTACVGEGTPCDLCIALEIGRCAAELGCGAAVDTFSCCTVEECGGDVECPACAAEIASLSLCAGAVATQCRAAPVTCFPPQAEVCDGFDNDRDEGVDEEVPGEPLCPLERVCREGACVAPCADDVADCDDDLVCETPIQANPQACGGCDFWCESGFCASGGCLPNLVAVAESHGCAISIASFEPLAAELWCWGEADRFGGSGRTTPVRVDLPRAVASPVRVAVGDFGTCVINATDGAVACATRGETFRRRMYLYEDRITIDEFNDVHVGDDHFCLRSSASAVFCEGANDLGQLGRGAAPGVLDRATLVGAVDIAGGRNHTCARLADSSVVCWGANDRAQLSGSARSESGCTPSGCSTPVQVIGTTPGGVPFALTGSRQLFGGSDFTCSADTPWWCWGEARDVFAAGPSAEFGVAIETLGVTETTVGERSITSLQTMAGGDAHLCGITPERTVVCSGANDRGQLGVERSTEAGELVRPLGDETTAHMIAAGGDTSCALIEFIGSGPPTVACWGANESGQAGQAPSAEPIEPMAVAFP